MQSSSTQALRGELLRTLSEETRGAALEAAHAVLTEANTDALIAIIMERLRLPFWLRWLPVETILDRLLPDVLLRLAEDLLG